MWSQAKGGSVSFEFTDGKAHMLGLYSLSTAWMDKARPTLILKRSDQSWDLLCTLEALLTHLLLPSCFLRCTAKPLSVHRPYCPYSFHHLLSSSSPSHNDFLISTLFNFLVILHHFMYPNQASYKVIHPGLIGTTKKLCYSQTGKLESPDLKVG